MTTQTDLDALIAARNNPALEVQYSDGRRVRYRSTQELERAIAAAQGELSSQTTTRRRAILFSTSKGL